MPAFFIRCTFFCCSSNAIVFLLNVVASFRVLQYCRFSDQVFVFKYVKQFALSMRAINIGSRVFSTIYIKLCTCCVFYEKKTFLFHFTCCINIYFNNSDYSKICNEFIHLAVKINTPRAYSVYFFKIILMLDRLSSV